MQIKEKFDYFLIPYESHTLYTKLKESEMEKRFYNRTVSPAPSSLTRVIYPTPEEYEGEFYTNAFYMQSVVRDRKAQIAITYGVIEEEETRTKIHLTIQLETPLNIMLPIFFLISCLVLISVVIDIGFPKEALILTLFFIVFFLFFTFIFKFKSAAVLYDLKKMFEAEETFN